MDKQKADHPPDCSGEGSAVNLERSSLSGAMGTMRVFFAYVPIISQIVFFCQLKTIEATEGKSNARHTRGYSSELAATSFGANADFPDSSETARSGPSLLLSEHHTVHSEPRTDGGLGVSWQ